MKVLYIVLHGFLLLFSCTMQGELDKSDSEQTILSIVNWNLQTFFDSQTTGTEYDDYQGSKSKWSEEKYRERIQTLCLFIEKTQADVYIFQEIENSGILQDIANELVKYRLKYEYSCFSKQQDEALGIAIMSRLKLQNIKSHHIDYSVAIGLNDFETSKDISDGMILEQPSMRSMLYAQVYISEEKSFSLYACHWKSKFGGAEKSEVWRNAQERLLADFLLTEDNLFLVAGDFNRGLEEFVQGNVKKSEIVLRGTKKNISVLTPWRLSDHGSVKGSYYYKGNWEKIDHFFYSKSLEVLDFQTIENEITVTEEGVPFRYNPYNGKGSSDHLPLHCVIEI